MLTDVFVANAPAGSGGTGSVGVLGGRSAVLAADERRWADLRGTGLPCGLLLGRPAAAGGRTLPAAVAAVPAVVPTTPRNAVPRHPVTPTTPIDTFGTTLGIHLPGRPTS